MTIRSDPRRWQPEFELIPIMVLGRRLIILHRNAPGRF